MFNLKEQNAPVDHNSDAESILKQIKHRLGLVDETPATPAPQSRREFGENQERLHKSPQEEQGNRFSKPANVIPQESYQQDVERDQSFNGYEAPSHSSAMNDLDDDFSFDLDFTESSSAGETNANKAYRAYQNAMKSPYGESEIDDQNHDFEEMQSDDLEQEWDSLESDDEVQDDDVFSWDNEIPTESNAQESENVYFLKNNHAEANPYNSSASSQNQYKNEDQEIMSSFGEVAANIENALAQVARQEIHNWCDNNLENICRKIIREELYKEKVDLNSNQ